MKHYQSYNVNPTHARVGDCVIRAISTALNQDWEKTYIELCLQGFLMNDLPNADHVWGEYLRGKGFERHIVPCDGDICVSVEDFCEQHPQGTFIVCPRNHVICVIDGEFFDTWNSGNEIVIYYWTREE